MIKKQKRRDRKSKPKVRFVRGFFVCFGNFVPCFGRVYCAFWYASQQWNRKRDERARNRIDKTKLNIIYIWVSLLGCLKPLPEFERIIFFSLMSFNRHSIQRTAAAAFMALWIDSAFAWLGDFVLFFLIGIQKIQWKERHCTMWWQVKCAFCSFNFCGQPIRIRFHYYVCDRINFALFQYSIKFIWTTDANKYYPVRKMAYESPFPHALNSRLQISGLFYLRVMGMKTEKYPIRFYRYFRLQLAPFYLYKFHG